MKLTQAFGIKDTRAPGSAFDFEAQKEERLKKLEERRNKFTY